MFQSLCPKKSEYLAVHLLGDLNRLEFYRSMLQKHRDDPLILFMDESCFTRCRIFNLRNGHEWADANPRATVTRHSQFRFKINYCVGILGNNVLGAVELPSNLNCELS
ncbi:hypothetical protein NQ318_022675 [Aromia moschata]|uniref:Transposase n=1 Tax=Aromia moschata TaxID=1265417 RepID=A0AAV8YNJ3_9CUCU|nr:hypothetical protein NQ318_022675 [Aromia moschata]